MNCEYKSFGLHDSPQYKKAFSIASTRLAAAEVAAPMPDHEEGDAPLLALRRRRAVLGDAPPRLHGPRIPGR